MIKRIVSLSGWWGREVYVVPLLALGLAALAGPLFSACSPQEEEVAEEVVKPAPPEPMFYLWVDEANRNVVYTVTKGYDLAAVSLDALVLPAPQVNVDVAMDATRLNEVLEALLEDTSTIRSDAVTTGNQLTELGKMMVEGNRLILDTRKVVKSVHEGTEDTSCLFTLMAVQTPDPTVQFIRPTAICGENLRYHVSGPPPGPVIGPMPPNMTFGPLTEEEEGKAGFR